MTRGLVLSPVRLAVGLLLASLSGCFGAREASAPPVDDDAADSAAETAPGEGTFVDACWSEGPPSGPAWADVVADANAGACWDTILFEPGCSAMLGWTRRRDEGSERARYDAAGTLVTSCQTSDEIDACNEAGTVSNSRCQGVREACAVQAVFSSPGCVPTAVLSPAEPELACEGSLQGITALDLAARRAEGVRVCQGEGGYTSATGAARVLIVPALEAGGVDVAYFDVYDPATGALVARYFQGRPDHCPNGTWLGDPHPECHGQALSLSAACGIASLP